MNRWLCAIALLALAGSAVPGCDNSNPSRGGLAALLGIKPQGEDRFTILLMTFPKKQYGEDYVGVANHFEAQTRKYTGWENVFVIHKDDHSLLFCKSIDEAEPYLRKAQAFRSKDTGLMPFAQAMTVPLPGSHPGPPEWNILNVPKRYYYTVLVADFFNVPDPPDPRDPPYLTRKEDAATFCRELRQQGYEAYYHHGPSHSGVMIGTFDNSVVRIVHEPGKPPRKEVIGKEVLAIQKRKPYVAVNGHQMLYRVKDPSGKVVSKVPEKSRLIIIPGRKPPKPQIFRPPETGTVPDRPRIFP